jgi:GT2 family glycosyltransferase
MPQTVIIVVTWNSGRYLSALFSSLLKMEQKYGDWELVVVDNNSQDKTRILLKEWRQKMPELKKIIYNRANLGFAAANNQGIAYALARGAEYIALLNDDTLLEPDWLLKIIKLMSKNQRLGLVQPLITRYPAVDKINSFGNLYQFTGFGYSYGDNCAIDSLKLEDYQPAYLSFAAVVIKSAVFKSIGLLDENYFAYHEDTDFCFRARLDGWNLLAHTAAVVHHRYKFPSQKNKRRYFWLEKNRLYLMLKFFKPKTLILIAPAFVFMEFGLILFSLYRGFFIQRLRAYAWFIRHLKTVFSQRRLLQRARKFDDRRLFDFMVGEIRFQELANPLLTYLANPLLNLYFKIINKFI